MKKHLFTVVLTLMLTAVLFAFAIAAVDTKAVKIETAAAVGVDLSALKEGDTFDVYITVPLTLGKTNQYYYRGYNLDSDSETANFVAKNAKLTEETLTLSWTTADMYVSAVETVAAPPAGKTYATATELQAAGEVGGSTLYYVFPASTPAAAAGTPTITGTGDTTATELKIEYSAAMNGYLMNLNKVTSKPSPLPTTGVIAKVTFTVAAESGQVETIILHNSHKISGVEEAYNTPKETEEPVTVTIVAGCVHPVENRDYDNIGENTNIPATCYATGEKWFYCNSCGKYAKEDVAMTEHSFTEYRVEKVATCWANGTAKCYCANEGCTEYDHTQGTDGVISLEKLTHEAGDFTDTATCTEDGYAFYTCTKCGGVSADGNTFFNVSYNSDTASFINNNTGAAFAVSDAFKSYAKGHSYVQNAEDPNKYVCSVCTAEQIIDATSRVRYVAQNGVGDGKSAENPTTLRQAFDDLGLLPAAVDGEIRFVGKKYVFEVADFVNDTCSSCFEESKHENHITVTSADPENKTILQFNAEVKFYFLYGPTTFENVRFASTVEGKAKTAGDSADSGGVSICARGFALVMGEGLEMLSSGDGMQAKKKYLDDISVDIPDVKMYIAGGFYNTMIYPGADPATVQTDVTILSGEYWNIEGLNRGGSTSYNGAHANITFAGGTFANVVPTTSMSNATFAGNDTIIDIHYVPGDTYICAFDYRSGINAMTGDITVNRFFHKGASMQIGDFMMGSTTVTNNTRYVNCYWEEGLESDKYVLHFLFKGNQYAKTYAEVNKNGTFAAYCIDAFGAHDYVNDVCTRCGITKCVKHTYSVLSETPATCVSEGNISRRCDYCGEYDYEILPVVPGAHDYHFDITDPNLYKCICSYCGDILCTVDPKTAMQNGALYVSDNGVPHGGFTPTLPLNDYETALKIAAASGKTDVTIYIVGKITIGSNTAYSVGAAFLEPEHFGTHFTVCGYDTDPDDDEVGLGMLIFDYQGGSRSVYGLCGDTAFDAVELSSGEEKGNLYIVARHNNLAFGEHMTSDYLRSANGGDYHGGNAIVIGGCYSNVFGACQGGDTHVEIHSGTYRAIYGGSVSQACPNLNEVTLDLLGNIMAREIIVFGSRGSGSNPISAVNVTVDGDVQSGAQICFGSFDNNPTVRDVSIVYRHGYARGYAFGSALEANATNLSNYTKRILGSNADDNDFSKQITGSISCFYNSSDKVVTSIVKSLAAQFKSLGNAKKPGGVAAGAVFAAVAMDCSVTGLAHTDGELISSKPSTCTEAGYETRRCTDCGETFTVILAKAAHTMTAWADFSEASCVSPKIQKQYCQACGYIKYKTVGEVAPNAHHLEDGVCTYCGYDQTLDCEHVWDSDTGVLESNGKCGSHLVKTCTVCGRKVVVEGSEIGSHDYGKFTVKTEPTATTPGLKIRTCKDCGKVDTAILYATDGALNSEGVAVDENGKSTEIDTAKLSKKQKDVVNAFLSTTEIGTEVKYAFKVNPNGTATFSIPLPEKYADLKNVKVMVKGDDGKITEVNFTVDRGYIVFTY